ncbi:MAG: glycosyltransferase family 4 protein [Bacteroidaceae bacterium]|nr:glycosyltransferase family 4 protein [Bacteroidaceae bacterium]
MRIVYCTPSLYLAGGVERVLTTKVNYLADVGGHDVTVILTDGKGKEPFYKLSPKVKVVQLDIGFERMWNRPLWQRAWIYIRGMRRYKQALRKTLMELRADIVVSTMRREINFICDIPDGSHKIGELHVTRKHYRNFEANENNSFKQWLSNRWSCQLVEKVQGLDALVVLTPHEVTQWPELENVRCIPNPLPFHIASDEEMAARQRHNDASGAVICVGRYSYQKGIDLLLNTWAEVSKQHPSWRLDIYGSGDRKPYQQQAVDLGLLPDATTFESRTLRLLPASDDIRSEYLSHDIYALSSRFEGFGMVIIEAEACGLPVVAFDCPTGPKELVDDTRTGLLVPDGDVAAMASALNKLIKEKALREQMSIAARKAVMRFDVQNVMLQWQQLFAEITSF